ncbi:MAG: hypothetical protein ACFFC7_25065, partial [Candidatus Hermodarchaeota archaeon]
SCSSSGILKISDILGWVHFQRSGDTVNLNYMHNFFSVFHFFEVIRILYPKISNLMGVLNA